MSNKESKKKSMSYNLVKGFDSENLSSFAIAPIARSTKDVPKERHFEWDAIDTKGIKRKCSCRFQYGLKRPNYKTEEVLVALCFLLLKQREVGGNDYVLDTSHMNIYNYLSFDTSRKPSAKDFKMISDHLDALMDTKIELQYVTSDGKYKRLVKSTIIQKISYIDEVSDKTYQKKNADGEMEKFRKAPKYLESVEFSNSFIDLFMNEVTFYDYYQYLWLKRPIPKRLYRIANSHKERTFDSELRRFCEVQLGMTGKSLENSRDLARRIKKEAKIVNSLGEGSYSVVRKKESKPSGYSLIYSNTPRLFSFSEQKEFWTKEEHEAFQALRSYNVTENQGATLINRFRGYFGFRSPDYIKYTILRFTNWINNEIGSQLKIPKQKLCALLLIVFKEGWYYKDFHLSGEILPESKEEELEIISSIAQDKTEYGTAISISLEDFEKAFPKQYKFYQKEVKEQLEEIGAFSPKIYNITLKNRCYWYAKNSNKKK